MVDLVIGTFPALYALAFLGLVLPSMFYLLALVPFGGIALLVFFVMDSSPDNQYGPSPKQVYAGV